MMSTTTVQVHEVAEQIVQVRLPLPFALNHVNCYLLDDGDGWTVLDTGLHWPDAAAGWRHAFQTVGIVPRQIRRIVLTHMHPDHFGMAGYLQGLSGAPIFVGAVEHAAIERVWVQDSWREAAATDFWRGAGLDESLLQVITEQVAALRQRTMPHPTHLEVIDENQCIHMGGRDFQPIVASGHSDGQIIFYSAQDQLMLCGDQVLERITPNIGLWPGNVATPLQNYLTSLQELAQLDVALALPGHYGLLDSAQHESRIIVGGSHSAPRMTAWQERITTLQVHHQERLAAMLAAVESINEEIAEYPCTALTVARRIFNFQRFSEHEIRFAVAETLAHLVHLMHQGQLNEEIRNGIHHYSRL